MSYKYVKVLVIWNEFTEGLKFIVLSDPSRDELRLLTAVHMHYINSLDTKISLQKEIDKVYAAAFETNESNLESHTRMWFGRWRGDVYTEKTLSGVSNITQIFITGMFP